MATNIGEICSRKVVRTTRDTTVATAPNLPEIITLHGVTRSPALENDIRSRVEKLRQFHQAITSCRVVVERPHRHHHQGGHFVVRLLLAVPGGDFAVNHDHAEDVHVAVRDAFDAARRRLQDHVSQRDGRAKSHRAARSAAGKPPEPA